MFIIKTPWTSKGYFNKNNKKQVKKTKFNSGDLGYFNQDNELIITGRKKDIIIRGGINISPKKIEEYLNFLEYFDNATIIGIKDKYFGEKTLST